MSATVAPAPPPEHAGNAGAAFPHADDAGEDAPQGESAARKPTLGAIGKTDSVADWTAADRNSVEAGIKATMAYVRSVNVAIGTSFGPRPGAAGKVRACLLNLIIIVFLTRSIFAYVVLNPDRSWANYTLTVVLYFLPGILFLHAWQDRHGQLSAAILRNIVPALEPGTDTLGLDRRMRRIFRFVMGFGILASIALIVGQTLTFLEGDDSQEFGAFPESSRIVFLITDILALGILFPAVSATLLTFLFHVRLIRVLAHQVVDDENADILPPFDLATALFRYDRLMRTTDVVSKGWRRFLAILTLVIVLVTVIFFTMAIQIDDSNRANRLSAAIACLLLLSGLLWRLSGVTDDCSTLSQRVLHLQARHAARQVDGTVVRDLHLFLTQIALVPVAFRLMGVRITRAFIVKSAYIFLSVSVAAFTSGVFDGTGSA